MHPGVHGVTARGVAALQDAPVPVPGLWGWETPQGKCAVGLRIWRWEVSLGNGSQRRSACGRGRRQGGGDAAGEERPWVQGHEARSTDTSSVGRDREADPLRAAGRSQLCRHLDVFPGETAADLRPPARQRINCAVPGHWVCGLHWAAPGCPHGCHPPAPGGRGGCWGVGFQTMGLFSSPYTGAARVSPGAVSTCTSHRWPAALPSSPSD